MSFSTKYPFDLLRNTLTDGNRYWFYHKAYFGKRASYPVSTIYKDILSTATNEIRIWDPWYNTGEGHLFDSINNNVTLLFLLQKGCNKIGNVYDISQLQSIFDDIKNNINPTGNIIHPNNIQIGVRSINSLHNKEWDFHDRFLIIDKTEVYLIGSSMGYYYQSKEATGIYKVNDDTCKNFIIDLFDEYWAVGVSTEVPVQFI